MHIFHRAWVIFRAWSPTVPDAVREDGSPLRPLPVGLGFTMSVCEEVNLWKNCGDYNGMYLNYGGCNFLYI